MMKSNDDSQQKAQNALILFDYFHGSGNPIVLLNNPTVTVLGSPTKVLSVYFDGGYRVNIDAGFSLPFDALNVHDQELVIDQIAIAEDIQLPGEPG